MTESVLESRDDALPFVDRVVGAAEPEVLARLFADHRPEVVR